LNEYAFNARRNWPSLAVKVLIIRSISAAGRLDEAAGGVCAEALAELRNRTTATAVINQERADFGLILKSLQKVKPVKFVSVQMPENRSHVASGKRVSAPKAAPFGGTILFLQKSLHLM